ncbi:hypothetical protein [Paraflavitalea sp. CAU 1676]|uniref:hypothetical protein n=1 Tax=Paraflavitalea sp. CAU 1676 TaxID=3032598 RepID=UPI0023DA90BB|nr:hypothetical protein [Paraflavitalea sp. CAU 1676]MDF2191524.1 hypothetical protein [Paraflavitalea sp. CAU 1676]
MKKPAIILGIIMSGSLAFTSCTKDLKNDISDLKKEVDSLHSSNDSIAGRLNGIDIILGANEPIVATTTFTDNSNATRTIKSTYKFKAGNSSTQVARGYADGTYEIYIERFGDVEWDEGAAVRFRYNPTTKAITEKRVYHYWDNADAYQDRAYYGEGYDTHEGLTINITVNNFNITTGEISLNVSASGNADYATAVYNWGYAPANGKAYNTAFTFAGKVKVWPYSGS